MNLERLTGQLIEWMREMVQRAGARGLVVGLSGGIDSATVAALCHRAFPDASLGVVMPCYSNPEDAAHAHLVASAVGIPALQADLADAYDIIVRQTGNPAGLAAANIKPRLRMTTLYSLAAQRQYLVAGTGNRSELVIGYYTKYGDGGVDLEPIGGLVKSQVRQLAGYLGIPRVVIDKSPSAGLWEGQTDESEMGFTYQQLDEYIMTGQAPPAVAERIKKLAELSEHKRQMPPIPPMPADQSSAAIKLNRE